MLLKVSPVFHTGMFVGQHLFLELRPAAAAGGGGGTTAGSHVPLGQPQRLDLLQPGRPELAGSIKYV